MRIILTLLGKDFALLRRNRPALVLGFVVPMIIIYVVGLVFGLGRDDRGPAGIRLAVVNASPEPAARQLVAALQAEASFKVVTEFVLPDQTTRPLAEADLRPLIRARAFSYALVLPEDLISGTRLGLRLRILSDPRNDIEHQIVQGLLQRTLFSQVPQLLGQSVQARARSFLGEERLNRLNHGIAAATAQAFGGDPEAIQQDLARGQFGLDRLTATGGGPGGGSGPAGGTDFLARLITIDTEQVVGRDVQAPEATRIIGGYAVMFLLFALSASAAAFFSEQNAGLFQRLLAAPVSRAQLLWGRFLYGVLFGLMQLSALFFAGHLLYGVDVFGHWGSLLLVCTCVAAACTSFGMLLSAVTKSPEAASGLATLLVITMSACGGAWFPISFMPEFMQHLARFTLVYWAVEGFGALLWAGEGLARLLPILGVLLGITAVAMTIAIRRFNRSKLFG